MDVKTISNRDNAELIFLVGVRRLPMARAEAEASLDELHRLAGSTTGEIVGASLANVRSPDAATFLTQGTIQELKGAIAQSEATTVVLDEDISPAQQHNLEDRWGVKLLNRSELILDIFAGRAHTADGKLQVELAQLQYRLPRLRGMGQVLSRLGVGIGARGPGEMKLETDRRVIERRIHTLEQRIKRLKRQRETRRARRQKAAKPAIALVGYTNAGKSTLLNSLTDAEAFVEDKLFATLDTTTRKGQLASGMRVTYTDTVGFINRLPTQLVAAFRATLEEVLYADILIHVVDATSPRYEKEIEVTRSVLTELGAGSTPVLTAWNKTDLLGPGQEDRFLEMRLQPSVAISALTGSGLDRLRREAETLIDQTRPRVWLRFGHNEYREVNRIENLTTVHELIHDAEGILVLTSLSPELAKRYADRRAEAPPTKPSDAEAVSR